eukprot:jgi/Tetstr1/435570/TSEL_024473.t1
MPDNSGDAPSGLAEDRIAALEAGFAGLTELMEALRSDLQRPSGSTPTEPRAPASSAAAASSQHDAPARAEQLYNISSDETHRQLIARRHWATLDQYRSLYCFGFYDAVAHAALCEALASIKRAASAAQPPGEEDLRLLEAGVASYDASNKHRRDFLAFIRLNASNDADARTKTVAHVAAVQQRFGVGPDSNEEEDNDDEPQSRARRRRPSGRRPRPDFRPTADDADMGKGKGKGKA